MSTADQHAALADVADELERRARDVQRPLPADWSQEEADERMAAALERLAERLRAICTDQPSRHEPIH